MPRVVGIEMGGTHVVLAVSREDSTEIAQREEVATTTPAETLARICAYLEAPSRSFDALGIASFGPLDLDRHSQSYGHITTTPKPGWADTDVVGAVRAALNARGLGHVPVAFETDVNAPACAEAKQMHSRTGGEMPNVCYVTVGTGVGVGAVVGGRPIHGALHPEGGHITCERHPWDDAQGFAGKCPFHGRCIEGMLAVGALAARGGIQARDLPNLPDDHFVWDIAAHYAAHLCASLTLLLSPHRIVLGGGLFQRKSLFGPVRDKLSGILNGYIRAAPLRDMATYVVPSEHGPHAGMVGAFAIAFEAIGAK